MAKGNLVAIGNITAIDLISIGIENMGGNVATRVQREAEEDIGEEEAILAMVELKTPSSIIQ